MAEKRKWQWGFAADSESERWFLTSLAVFTLGVGAGIFLLSFGVLVLESIPMALGAFVLIGAGCLAAGGVGLRKWALLNRGHRFAALTFLVVGILILAITARLATLIG